MLGADCHLPTAASVYSSFPFGSPKARDMTSFCISEVPSPISASFASLVSLSTAYFGGPLFPLMFAALCFGLALNIAVPGVPQGVAVMALMAGMLVAATAAPLSMTIFLVLVTNPQLASVIAIGAVASYIVRQAVAPTLPGVYRQTGAAEREAGNAA